MLESTICTLGLIAIGVAGIYLSHIVEQGRFAHRGCLRTLAVSHGESVRLPY